MADSYWDEVIAGAFDIFGSQVQANAARDAANTAREGYADAIQEMRVGTDEARRAILDRMNPALVNFNNQIVDLQNDIATGNADIVNIMAKTTGGVDQLLAGTGANVRAAMMGSAATSRGIPIQDFNQAFRTTLDMPPEQQTQAFQRLESSISSASRGVPPPNLQQLAGQPVSGLSAAGLGLPTTGGIAGAAGLPRGDGGGISDSDVGPVSGELPTGAVSALGRAAGGLFGGLLGGPLGTQAGQTLGSRLGDFAGGSAGGGPGALAGGSAGGDIASLAAAEAAAGISGPTGFTSADSTGGPSKGDPGESARLREQAIRGRNLSLLAKEYGWEPTVDANGMVTQGPEDFLRSQGVNVDQELWQMSEAGQAQQGQMSEAVAQSMLAQQAAQADAARIGYDVGPTAGRVGSAVTGAAVPGAQISQYAAPVGMPTGFAGAFGELEAGERTAMGQLAAGTGAARSDIMGALAGGMAEFDPYSEAGRAALVQQAAMTGALGPEAEQRAIESFMESPGQKYLREQQEKALLRSSAAIGGLGGANVRTALQEQAMGIAATQQQQRLQNLGSLSSIGMTAAGARAGMQTQAGTQMAALAESMGVRGADLTRMSSQQKAELARQAGMSLAQLEEQIGMAQIGNLERFGTGLANLRQGEIASQTSLGQLAATGTLESQQNIATMLANLATQQGTATAGLTSAAGQAGAAGQMAQGQIWGDATSRIGNLAAGTMAANQAPIMPVAPSSAPTTSLGQVAANPLFQAPNANPYQWYGA